jgi:hypothetical protein
VVCVHPGEHTHARERAHTHTFTVNTQTHTHTHTHSRARTHTHIHSNSHARLPVCMLSVSVASSSILSSYTRTMQARTHTHHTTHIHLLPSLLPPSPLSFLNILPLCGYEYWCSMLHKKKKRFAILPLSPHANSFVSRAHARGLVGRRSFCVTHYQPKP